MDSYYMDLDRVHCSKNLDQLTQDRLGRLSDLYSLNSLCPTSESNNNYNNYHQLLDSLEKKTITLTDIIEILRPLDWIDSTFIQEAKYRTYYNNDTIIIEPISLLEIEKFSLLSLSNKFITLRHLLANCDKFNNLEKPLEKNITLDLTFYLFEKYDLINTFPGLHIDMLQIKGTSYLTENEVNNIRQGKLGERYFRQELAQIKKHKIYNQFDIATGNLSISLLKQGDTLGAINLLSSTPILKDSFYIYINLAINHLDIDSNDLALNFLNKVRDLNGGYDSYLHQDFARAHAQNNNFDSAYFHYNKALKTDSLATSDSIDYFYIRELSANINYLEYQFTGEFDKLYRSYQALKERRKLGVFIFEDDLSHHANEFYAFNTGNLLKTSYQIQNLKGEIPDSISTFIEQCIIQSKQKNEYIDLNGYSRKTNTHVENYSNETFFHQYFEFFKNYDIETYKIDSTLVIQSKERELPKGNYSYLHFIKGRYHYWCLYRSKASTKLFKISIHEFEKALKSNYNLLKSNSLSTLPTLDFWSKLNLGINDTIIMYSDGILNEYPYPIDSNIVYSEYYKSQKEYLTSDISILSYTNPSTNSGFKELEFSELIGGYNESSEISKLYLLSKLYTGNECTIKNFKSAMSSDILHIAAHAYSDSINRLESYLILRDPFGKPTRLYADEILTMPTVPKFVNLSACQTGTGVHMAGAGTYSIARSFLQKGSEAVMKTLWDVDDEATKEFMIMFYTKWKGGLSCGEALRETKQIFKASKDYSNPYYWAGFILEGNPNLFISKN